MDKYVCMMCVSPPLLTQVEVTLQDVSRGKGFTFTHLTLQEFLCALHIMTSDEVNEAQLKRKFNLRSRWTTRADPKTVFTDSLHLYMCGLASPACTPTLVRLAEKAGAGDSAGAGAGGRTLSGSGFGAETWVKKHQAVVLKLLKSLAGSSSLTGPKVGWTLTRTISQIAQTVVQLYINMVFPLVLC